MLVDLQGVSEPFSIGVKTFPKFPWVFFLLPHETVVDKEGNIGFWALDPVDGTKGFLRGGQYAVALGLIVDGKVMVGAMACPNLPIDPTQPLGLKGVLFSATRNQGATVKPLDPASTTTPRDIHMNAISSTVNASFCESVEPGHTSHGANASIAQKLAITKPSIRMDSQAKYASIARGDGDIYLRLPSNRAYEEKIWVRIGCSPWYITKGSRSLITRACGTGSCCGFASGGGSWRSGD